ncbi:MAG: lysozyme family protein [Ruminiclostridium sp.]
MKQSRRLLSVIIAFCFMIGCFLPIQSYAISKKVVTNDQMDINNEVIQTQNTQDAEVDKEVMEVNDTPYYHTAGSDIDVTPAGKAIDVTITGATIDSTTTGSAISTTEVKDKDDTKDEENLWYRKQNPMKKEHQKLLWEYCKKRELNYIDMLALIYTESNFNEKCSTGTYYGYFQISKGNCANLAAELKTKNKPLDGTININWGTAMYSWILADKRVKDLEEKKKRDVALSIYQRGTGGYDKYGISTKFLKIFNKKRAKVCVWFEVKK